MQIRKSPSGAPVTLAPGDIVTGTAPPTGGPLQGIPATNAIYLLDCAAVAAPVTFTPAGTVQEGDLITLALLGELRSPVQYGPITVPAGGSAETVQLIQLAFIRGAWIVSLASVVGTTGGPAPAAASYYSGPITGAPDATLVEIARVEVELAVDNAKIQWDSSHGIATSVSTAWGEVIDLVDRGGTTVVATLIDLLLKPLNYDGPANHWLTLQGAEELSGVPAGSYDMRIRAASASGVATPVGPGSARVTVLP